MEHDHKTIFSSREFVESWCRAFGDCEPLAIGVRGSGPPRTMYVVKAPMRYGSYRISGPRAFDLWTSPGWTGDLSRFTVEHILDQLRGVRTRSLLWQVRFDHEPLAIMLSSLGFDHDRLQIHVLKLNRDYSELFANYNATSRNHVRKAARRGLIVRDTCDANDIFAYHAIYSRHRERQNWRFEYRVQMTTDLVKMRGEVCFKVAEHEGAIIGGALFVRDGNSVYYLHGVADRDYTHLYPASALIDAGIKWSRENGAEFLNLGHSGKTIVESLAAFKSSWGAHTEQNWLFKWENPLWTSAGELKEKLKSKVRPLKRMLLAPSNNGTLSNKAQNIPDSLSWSKRAQFDELRAVCVLSDTQKRNIIFHGAGLEVGDKALSLMRRRGIACPIVLDFGCGTGRMIRFFGKRGCPTVGLDITVEMLEAVKRHGLPENSLLAHFDGQSIPIRDCFVDIVWVSGVLKYTLFPPGFRCLHGVEQLKPSNKRFTPTCDHVVNEMYRVLKPGGIVAHCEMWIDEPPDVFRASFEQAGFVAEQVKLVRKDGDLLERFYRRRGSSLLPPLLTSRMLAKFRYHFGDPWLAGLRDYFIVWRKPLERGRRDQKVDATVWRWRESATSMQ